MRRPTHSPPQRLLAALLSALLVLGPGAAALAAPAKGAKTALLVLPYAPLPGTSDAFAARVTAQILAELRQRSELKLVDAPAQGASKESAAKAQNEADRAKAWATQQFNKAGELAQANRAKQAAQTLQRAAAQLAAQPLALDEAGGKLLGDILLQLSVARATAGDEEGADQSLAELVHRAPERTMQSGSFPPAFVRSFETARQRALSAARGTIRVYAPAGAPSARVLLDGRPLGVAPLLLTEALPGEHAVRVEGPAAGAGVGAWAETIKLEPGAELSLMPQLAGGAAGTGDAALAQGSLDRAAASRLLKLAKAANAQAALAGTVSREGDGYTVRSALVLVRSERVVSLAQLGLDAEMLSASLEVLRLADDLSGQLGGSAPGAALPLAMGASTSAAAAEAGPVAGAAFPSVIAAPPAAEGALALPAAADLAAAAGANHRDLPLPDATAAVASAPPPEEPHARTVALPAPAAPIASAPPAPIPPAPIAPAATALAQPAPAPAEAAPERRVSIPGAQAPPLPAAPEPAAAPLEAQVVRPGQPTAPEPAAALEAPLAAAGPKRVEEAPSKELFIPRNPTPSEPPDETSRIVAITAPDAPPAPPASVHMQALEANEVATVRDEPTRSTSHAALWIVAGALVVGAAIVGGVVLYSNSQSATSSNVSLSWSH